MDEPTAAPAECGLGPLPAGWTVERLRKLCRGDGRYGSPERAQAFDRGLPRYIRITDVTEDGTLRGDSRASLSRAKAEPYLLKPGDLLFARSGATVGKTYLYRRRDGDCAHAGYMICFRLNPERCQPDFVAQYTHSSYYWAWVKRTARQAAQSNINAAEYADLPVPVPPLDEQRRVAAVLAVADELIQTSARIVDKLEAVKRALLHDLLTFGVDARGQLRREGRRRRSPLGPVPRHWRVEPVQALLAAAEPAMRSGPFGSELKKSDLVEDGVPLLGIDNVGIDAFVPRYKRFVSRSKAARFERYAVRPGDVMITIMGTVGRSCVVPETVGRALSSKHVWTLTFDQERYVPKLASLQFNHAQWVREHFRRHEQGGTMSAIRSDTLRTTLLPVPPLPEQHRIVAILRAHEARLEAERAALEKHKKAKKALVNELFSGRLRISPDSEIARSCAGAAPAGG